MFATTSDLLTHINSIIQKTSYKDKYANHDFSMIQQITRHALNSSDKNDGLLDQEELKELGARVKKLEEQNDQLTCIVYFLFQKLTNLINNFWETERDQANSLKCNMCEPSTVSIRNNHTNIPEKEKPSLTKREMDVFNLLAKGLCAKEIAKTLFISETTVITHKRNLKEKFCAKNTVELVSKAFNILFHSDKTSGRFDSE
jgi:DNA-binding CsgD family transcriptional regulator